MLHSFRHAETERAFREVLTQDYRARAVVAANP